MQGVNAPYNKNILFVYSDGKNAIGFFYIFFKKTIDKHAKMQYYLIVNNNSEHGSSKKKERINMSGYIVNGINAICKI